MALKTVADHWGELTAVHPFRDGNSRTQRYFFDQMLRSAGWVLDWRKIDADEVHAARYVAVVTVDSTFLADALRPSLTVSDAQGTLTITQSKRDAKKSSEYFHRMLKFRSEHCGGSFHDFLHSGCLNTSLVDAAGIAPYSPPSISKYTRKLDAELFLPLDCDHEVDQTREA